MHNMIMQPPKDLRVDHINHNKLDNRRSNLRLCTKQQNQWNRRKVVKNTTSKYKGVCWAKKNNKWQASLEFQKDKKRQSIYLGQFISEVEAAKAYNEAAIKHFGEFAKINTF